MPPMRNGSIQPRLGDLLRCERRGRGLWLRFGRAGWRDHQRATGSRQPGLRSGWQPPESHGWPHQHDSLAYDIYGRQIAETNAAGVCVATNGYNPMAGSPRGGPWGKVWPPSSTMPTATSHAVYPGLTLRYEHDALNGCAPPSDSHGTTFSFTRIRGVKWRPGREDGPWNDDTSSGDMRTVCRAHGLCTSRWRTGVENFFYDGSSACES